MNVQLQGARARRGCQASWASRIRFDTTANQGVVVLRYPFSVACHHQLANDYSPAEGASFAALHVTA